MVPRRANLCPHPCIPSLSLAQLQQKHQCWHSHRRPPSGCNVLTVVTSSLAQCHHVSCGDPPTEDSLGSSSIICETQELQNLPYVSIVATLLQMQMRGWPVRVAAASPESDLPLLLALGRAGLAGSVLDQAVPTSHPNQAAKKPPTLDRQPGEGDRVTGHLTSLPSSKSESFMIMEGSTGCPMSFSAVSLSLSPPSSLHGQLYSLSSLC